MNTYIQLTKACNHDCIFCSSPKKDIDLSYDEVISRIDRFKKQGVGSSHSSEFVLTGGEPTLHPDLIRICSYLTENNLCFRIITNGVKLKDYGFVSKLYSAGLRRIIVSIHHYDPVIAKEISSSDDLYLNDTFEGLKNLSSFSDIDICINTTVIKQNYSILLKLAQFLISRYPNIHSYNFNYVDACGNVMTNDSSGSSIVPKYSECEKYLYDVFRYLVRKNITFRFERSPLCYSRGFEHYSSDANRNVGAEFYVSTFTEKSQGEMNYNMYGFVKSDVCKKCNLNLLCSGVSSRYAEIYGVDELYPVFDNPADVEYKIKLQNHYQEQIFFGETQSLDYSELKNNLDDAFSRIGGFMRYVKPHVSILLKPSFSNSSYLDNTNINLFKVLLTLLKKNNNSVVVADVFESDSQFEGLKQICSEFDIQCVNLSHSGYHKVSHKYSSKLDSFEVSNLVDEVDYILNFSKFKNTGKLSFCGAIDNVLGLLSPNSLSLIESENNSLDFSNMLVDVYSYFRHKICLNVLDMFDSVLNNVKSNYFIIARDGVSVDVLTSYSIYRDSSYVLTNQISALRKIGFLDLDRLNIIGDFAKVFDRG